MKGLHGWLRLLENNETAVLSGLLSELDRVIRSDNSSGEQLASIILKDAFLTSRILRVANSVLFNPTELPVTTVSRAVINIGFKNIRSICVSIKVLESLMDENSTPLMMCMLARSLHAASQAKSLCQNLSEIEQEEVFVATLIFHLAELLVLGFRDQEVKDYSKSLFAHSSEQDKDRAAEKYLGVSLTRLAKSLIKQWRMQGLILDVINSHGMETDQRKIIAVRLGNELSRAALLGWNSAEFKSVLDKVAEFKGGNVDLLVKSVKKVADETAEMIASFGKKNLAEFMPTSRRPAKALLIQTGSSGQLTTDLQFQQETLNRLGSLLRTDFNINDIISLVLKGLNSGVGLERVALALFDRLHCQFTTKYCLGEGTEAWMQSFTLCFDRNPASFLFKLFQSGQSVWVGGDQFHAISESLRNEFLNLTGKTDFFIAPLQSNANVIGFIYADAGSLQTALNRNAFNEFNGFIEKANLALGMLARRKHQAVR
jgi:HD-like signal output (HDOD) protein